MIDEERRQEMIALMIKSKITVSDEATDPEVWDWAGYYGADVCQLFQELYRLEEALKDILAVTGGWCRPMKDDKEKLRVIQDLAYEALDIKRSKEEQGVEG